MTVRRKWVAGVVLLGLSSLPLRGAEAVDVNRASVVELMRVPGMTATWAGRIVRFRPYRTKLDLIEQGVVTPEVYQRIRDGVVAHRLEGAAPAKKRDLQRMDDTR